MNVSNRTILTLRGPGEFYFDNCPSKQIRLQKILQYQFSNIKRRFLETWRSSLDPSRLYSLGQFTWLVQQYHGQFQIPSKFVFQKRYFLTSKFIYSLKNILRIRRNLFLNFQYNVASLTAYQYQIAMERYERSLVFSQLPSSKFFKIMDVSTKVEYIFGQKLNTSDLLIS